MLQLHLQPQLLCNPIRDLGDHHRRTGLPSCYKGCSHAWPLQTFASLYACKSTSLCRSTATHTASAPASQTPIDNDSSTDASIDAQPAARRRRARLRPAPLPSSMKPLRPQQQQQQPITALSGDARILSSPPRAHDVQPSSSTTASSATQFDAAAAAATRQASVRALPSGPSLGTSRAELNSKRLKSLHTRFRRLKSVPSTAQQAQQEQGSGIAASLTLAKQHAAASASGSGPDLDVTTGADPEEEEDEEEEAEDANGSMRMGRPMLSQEEIDRLAMNEDDIDEDYTWQGDDLDKLDDSDEDDEGTGGEAWEQLDSTTVTSESRPHPSKSSSRAGSGRSGSSADQVPKGPGDAKSVLAAQLAQMYEVNGQMPGRYIGPVQVQYLDGREWGLTATASLEPGELLLLLPPMAVLGRGDTSEAATTTQDDVSYGTHESSSDDDSGRRNGEDDIDDPVVPHPPFLHLSEALAGAVGGGLQHLDEVDALKLSALLYRPDQERPPSGPTPELSNWRPRFHVNATDSSSGNNSTRALLGAGVSSATGSSSGGISSSSGSSINGLNWPSWPQLAARFSEEAVEGLVRLNALGEVGQDAIAARCRGEELAAYAGLWPEFAMANHSCMPNATFAVVGGHLMLRAARPIEAGEELTVNYLGLGVFEGLEERQQALGDRWAFQCSCPRCRVEIQHQQALYFMTRDLDKALAVLRKPLVRAIKASDEEELEKLRGLHARIVTSVPNVAKALKLDVAAAGTATASLYHIYAAHAGLWWTGIGSMYEDLEADLGPLQPTAAQEVAGEQQLSAEVTAGTQTPQTSDEAGAAELSAEEAADLKSMPLEALQALAMCLEVVQQVIPNSEFAAVLAARLASSVLATFGPGTPVAKQTAKNAGVIFRQRYGAMALSNIARLVAAGSTMASPRTIDVATTASAGSASSQSNRPSQSAVDQASAYLLSAAPTTNRRRASSTATGTPKPLLDAAATVMAPLPTGRNVNRQAVTQSGSNSRSFPLSTPRTQQPKGSLFTSNSRRNLLDASKQRAAAATASDDSNPNLRSNRSSFVHERSKQLAQDHENEDELFDDEEELEPAEVRNLDPKQAQAVAAARSAVAAALAAKVNERWGAVNKAGSLGSNNTNDVTSHGGPHSIRDTSNGGSHSSGNVTGRTGGGAGGNSSPRSSNGSGKAGTVPDRLTRPPSAAVAGSASLRSVGVPDASGGAAPMQKAAAQPRASKPVWGASLTQRAGSVKNNGTQAQPGSSQEAAAASQQQASRRQAKGGGRLQTAREKEQKVPQAGNALDQMLNVFADLDV